MPVVWTCNGIARAASPAAQRIQREWCSLAKQMLVVVSTTTPVLPGCIQLQVHGRIYGEQTSGVFPTMLPGDQMLDNLYRTVTAKL